MRNTNVIITGASSGLGAGMAREFARRGHDLGLCARRLERLASLKAELEAAQTSADSAYKLPMVRNTTAHTLTRLAEQAGVTR